MALNSVNSCNYPVVCPEDKVFIYTLSDPETGEVRYVGKTIQTLSERLGSHHYKAKKEKLNHTKAWIYSLRKKGMKPRIDVLDLVDRSNWEQEEIFYIAYLKYLGVRLTNHRPGGEDCKPIKPKIRSGICKVPIIRVPRNKNKELYLYDIKGNEIEYIKDINEISQQLKISAKVLYGSISRKRLIDKQYYILRRDDPVLERIKNNSKIKRLAPIKAICLDSGEEVSFNGIKDASKTLGIHMHTISNMLRGVTKNTGRRNNKKIYRFEYV